MAQIKGLDAHDRPPEAVRLCFKKYSRLPLSEIDNDPGILDLQGVDPDNLPPSLTISQYMSSQELRLAFDDFIRGGHASGQDQAPLAENMPVYIHNAVSGQPRLASVLSELTPQPKEPLLTFNRSPDDPLYIPSHCPDRTAITFAPPGPSEPRT